jgi:acetyl-CoA carboxylase biotin carboxylase subunit
MQFEKILVANRGEIACRIIKSIKKLGIKSVAVYSDADRDALHVKMADEAYHIGPSPSAQSYLDMEKIISVCKQSKATGVHPGYGFLSENAIFAERLQAENIKLIGPSAHSMRIMGDKLSSKDAVKAFDIPMVPGTDYAIEEITEAMSVADEIGYPVLIKASAGGGGKGMKLAQAREEMADQMQLAINEATAAFGNGAVFIEKFVTSPRHIEIQVLADSQGNCVYLFERECSIQRRHQKVVEEATSTILTPKIRKAMGEAAVKVAQACQYEGAGTVEFLVDDALNFYFLEMNTRLQVEHPITEMITGLDLVEQQIKVASGAPLDFTQENLAINGHAIELRIYAEDPHDNFAPSINVLAKYTVPTGENIRVDNGYQAGDQIPIYYDPMLAKLVTYGQTRHEAINLMKSAISQFHIEGVSTTLDFGAFVMQHPDFISGNFDTNFVQKNWHIDGKKDLMKSEALVAAELAKHLLDAFDGQLVI